jgi:hypothetical protein
MLRVIMLNAIMPNAEPPDIAMTELEVRKNKNE